jgi:hypothetical protein
MVAGRLYYLNPGKNAVGERSCQAITAAILIRERHALTEIIKIIQKIH